MSLDPLWGGGALSVVLLPAGAEGAGILAAAREWTASRLLAPAMWVRVEDVPLEAPGPPQVPALILGRNEQGVADEVKVELFWQLGLERRERVRLVAIRTLQSPDDQLRTSRAVGRLSTYLGTAMPAQLASLQADPAKRNLLRLNLIIDAAEQTGLRGSDVFQPDWEANIVASPEDRTTPDGVDAPPIHPRLAADVFEELPQEAIDRPERYYGWALAHVATAAGLWAGVPRSVYDMSVNRPTVGYSMCLVQRVTVRGVISDGLAIDLALNVLREASEASAEAQELQQDAMRKHRVDVVSAESVSEFSDGLKEFAVGHLRGQGFGYVPPPSEPPGTRALDVSLGDRLRLFFRLLGRGISSLPRFLVQMGLRRISSKLTVEGGDAVVVTDMTWRGGLPTVDSSMFTIPALPENAGVVSTAPPQAWRDMRLLLLASLDGGEPPMGAVGLLTRAGSANRLVYPTRTDAIPNPSDPWVVPAAFDPDRAQLEDVQWWDAASASKQLDALARLIDEATPRLRSARQADAAAKDALRRHDRELEGLIRTEERMFKARNQALQSCESTQADHPHTQRRGPRRSS